MRAGYTTGYLWTHDRGMQEWRSVTSGSLCGSFGKAFGRWQDRQGGQERQERQGARSYGNMPMHRLSVR